MPHFNLYYITKNQLFSTYFRKYMRKFDKNSQFRSIIFGVMVRSDYNEFTDSSSLARLITVFSCPTAYLTICQAPLLWWSMQQARSTISRLVRLWNVRLRKFRISLSRHSNCESLLHYFCILPCRTMMAK